MSEWFEEQLEKELGRMVKIRVEKRVESYRSRFQTIDVYETIPFGKMLVHDDVIMLTEFDEAHYHEMIAHVALCVHPQPLRVLIIGGGDGGTLREVLKHRRVQQADLCEIDPDVVRLCKKHFPALSCSFCDPRARVIHADGAEYVKRQAGEYDLIIVDSSDPIGPAEVLFQKDFYRDMFTALKPDGIVISQSESFVYHREIIDRLAGFCRNLFPLYRYYYTLVPTYPSGLIGFSFASRKYHPLDDFQQEGIRELEDLRYYTAAVHRAAFTLPRFAEFLNNPPEP